LANIREVSAICHIVRVFEDEDVAHVEKNIAPLSDAELINSELIIADLQTLEKQKEPKGSATAQEKEFFALVNVLKEHLSKGILASQIEMSAKEKMLVKELCLLTSKPILYVLNISEEQIKKKEQIAKDFSLEPKIALSAKMEDEINILTESEKKEYLMQYNLEGPGLERLIKLSYQILGLISFFSAEPKEVHAWTIKEGTTAREAAGVIHTDFYKHFIKAATISFEEFSASGGWNNAKNAGKIRFEGADYIVQKADVIDFKVGCS
jgi:ribosome-binding ATPase